MRKKGIIILAVFIVIVIALSLIFTDRWLEKRLESGGSALLGARVEIDNLDVSLLRLHVRWDSLQATNPNNTMKNILTTGRTEFDMQLVPLLSKKVVIEDIVMTHVTSGTERMTDGKIEKKKKAGSNADNILAKTMDRLEKNITSAPVWNLESLSNMNLDSILQVLQIHSPQKIDSLQNEFTKTYAMWDSAFAKVTWKDDFNFLNSRLSAIEPDDIKTLEGLQTAYQTLEKVKARVDSLGSFVKKTRTHLSSDLQDAATQAAHVDDWIAADYNNALAQAKLPSIDKAGIAQMLFGDTITRRVVQVLGLLNKARSYSAKFASDKPKKEKPPRMKGQTIYFKGLHPLPNFWVKNVELSGMTQTGLTLEGRIRNIVSNQKMIGAATTAVINLQRADGASARLSGELNYLGPAPQEQLLLKMSDAPLKNITFSSDILAAEMTSAKGNGEASLVASEDTVTGALELSAKDMKFDFKETANDPLQQTVQKIVQNAKTVHVSAMLRGMNDKTQLDLSSNLDNLFSKELKAIAGAEIDKARSAIHAKVESQVGGAKQKFDDYVKQEVSLLETEMSTYEELLNNQNELLASKKKKMDERIAQEKKKAQKNLQGEAKKKLKGLFDK